MTCQREPNRHSSHSYASRSEVAPQRTSRAGGRNQAARYPPLRFVHPTSSTTEETSRFGGKTLQDSRPAGSKGDFCCGYRYNHPLDSQRNRPFSRRLCESLEKQVWEPGGVKKLPSTNFEGGIARVHYHNPSYQLGNSAIQAHHRIASRPSQAEANGWTSISPISGRGVNRRPSRPCGITNRDLALALSTKLGGPRCIASTGPGGSR